MVCKINGIYIDNNKAKDHEKWIKNLKLRMKNKNIKNA